MRKPILMIGVATAVLASHTAFAGTEQSQQKTSADKTSQAAYKNPEDAEPTIIANVVVTAQRRSQRLLDVPMSLSVVTGTQLAKSGVNTMDDLRQVTPGLLTVNNGFAFLPEIRGIQSSGTSPGDATNVAIYLDDVAVGAPIAGLMDLSDIDRIEVLKGPQGTLFGRNATGGAIRIFTQQPSFTANGHVGADYGFNFHDLKLTGYATGPLSDTVAASISASYRKGDGFIKGIGPDAGRTYGGADNYAVRGKLLYKPSSQFSVVFSVDNWTQHNNNTFTAGHIGPINPYPGSIFSGVGTYAGGTQPKAYLRGTDGSINLRWDPSDAFHLHSITAYRYWRMDAQNDADLTSLPIDFIQIGQKENTFSQELDLSGEISNNLMWIAGAYYFDTSAGNPYFRFGLGDAPTGTVISNFKNHVQSYGFAGFGELTWTPIAHLHLTGGARYSTETKHFRYQGLVAPAGATLHMTDARHTWDSPTYRFVARYDLSSNANVYASISNGFKSGVYNSYSYLNNPVNPEKVMAYEVGTKALINGITFTAAAYAYEYKNIQVSAYVTVNNQLLVSLSNAATARMRGFEFSADGQIAPGLYFNAGLSWEPVAKYVHYNSAQVVVPIPGATGPVVAQVEVPYDASDSHTVRTPQLTGNVRLHYQKLIGGGQLSADINGAYTSAYYWQPGNFSREKPSFIANTRIGYTDLSSDVTYSIFVNNLTDATYFTDRVPNVLGSDTAEVAPGREVGIGIEVNF